MSHPVPADLARGFVTRDLPPVPGRAKSEPEDFEVEEVPLYLASGQGGHVYLWIEKRGIPTDEAVRRLSKRLGVHRRVMGHAGLKDARAVTRQTISVAWREEALPDLEALGDDQMRVLEAKRHKNKLKIGHLLGNTFRLRIRGGASGLEAAQAGLAQLEAKGVANYYGLQRFGRERHTHLLGQALVREEPETFLRLLLLGGGGSEAPPRLSEARAAAEASDYAGALELYPRSHSAERSLCSALAGGRAPDSALKAVSLKQRTFYVAAFQSYLFNAYLTQRLDRIDVLEAGDVATLHRNNAAFVVEEVAVEQPRCAAFEISPSGPMFGRKLLRPAEGSAPHALEEAILSEHAPGLGPGLGEAYGSRPLGLRRPLRIPLSDSSVEVHPDDADDLLLSFFLPKGCYATSVLEELFKRPQD